MKTTLLVILTSLSTLFLAFKNTARAYFYDSNYTSQIFTLSEYKENTNNGDNGNHYGHDKKDKNQDNDTPENSVDDYSNSNDNDWEEVNSYVPNETNTNTDSEQNNNNNEGKDYEDDTNTPDPPEQPQNNPDNNHNYPDNDHDNEDDDDKGPEQPDDSDNDDNNEEEDPDDHNNNPEEPDDDDNDDGDNDDDDDDNEEPETPVSFPEEPVDDDDDDSGGSESPSDDEDDEVNVGRGNRNTPPTTSEEIPPMIASAPQNIISISAAMGPLTLGNNILALTGNTAISTNYDYEYEKLDPVEKNELLALSAFTGAGGLLAALGTRIKTFRENKLKRNLIRRPKLL